MTHRICRFELEPKQIQTIDMPAGAEILCAQYVGDTLSLWVRADDRAPREPRTFGIFGMTGAIADVSSPTFDPVAPRPAEGRYVGSATSAYGHCWHIFEKVGAQDG